MKGLKIWFFMMFICSNSIIGQDNDIEQRLETIEKKVDKIENRVERIEKLEEIIEQKIDLAEKELAQDYNLVGYIGVPISLVFIGSLIYGLFKIRTDVMNFGTKYLEDSIVESLLEKKEKELADLFLKQAFENRVKTEKKIIIVSENREKKDQIDRLIKILGFKSTESYLRKTYEELPNADLVIFNQIMDEDLILRYFEDNLPFPFIGYYPEAKSPVYDKRFAFVNLEYTLYTRIIEVSKYMDYSSRD